MNADRIGDELDHLLGELVDGALDDGQAARLRAILLDDPEAQDRYCRLMDLHARLFLEAADGGSLADLPGLDLPGTRPAPKGVRSLLRTRSARVAASVAAGIVALLSVQAWRPPGPRPGPAVAVAVAPAPAPPPAPLGPLRTEANPASPPAPVAVLTRVVQVRWGATDLPREEGAALPPGRLLIEEGCVQIEFVSGATVILEGPADFELVSSSRASCRLGRLRSHVPPHARGFTIGGPGIDAVDLGTEFAMQVDGLGRGEVHVLEGEVELHGAGDRPASTTVQTLSAGKAMSFASGGEPRRIAAAPEGFVGRARLTELERLQNERRFRRWLDHSRKLRADPATVAYYDFDGHQPWERVLRNRGVASDPSLDGAVVGCLWTEGRWPGKHALEFKRTGDRVRLMIPGEFASLSLAAWVRIEGLGQWLSALLLTDSWDTGEVHWQISDKGEIILGVQGDLERKGRGRGGIFFSPPVLTPSDLGRWVHLASVYDGPNRTLTQYLDGKAISRHGLGDPMPVRIGTAEIGNWQRGARSEKDSMRTLNGRIDEFAIIARPMGPDEVQAMYEVGRPNR